MPGLDLLYRLHCPALVMTFANSHHDLEYDMGSLSLLPAPGWWSPHSSPEAVSHSLGNGTCFALESGLKENNHPQHFEIICGLVGWFFLESQFLP